MQGVIRVYECEKRDRQSGKGSYFFVVGKMGGLTASFVSDIALTPGEHTVDVQLSEYGGKLSVKIMKEVK